ncbi:hypothetical protein AMATHDRAFT_3060 [Amanita thiersii Skay4041]|uniref:Peroxisomal membrane protein PEX14 n=1 Tax=Amanita thiersii Skay4041 TaxID=703135 RepID=A0A2A9NLI1_9AGAR|nr:hypothetical protein AMATHDRAFT_3060 [Amanita thiersii Skay4041]
MSDPSKPPSSSSAAPQHEPDLDRTDLLSRARTFLKSPQVTDQDAASKRKFLIEKGLHENEIDTLLQEAPHTTPAIPPRNYPQPPPSNLPNLILGLARVFSWITGGSAILLFIYWRFLLPRIVQTSLARRSLRSHYSTLLQKFTSSLSSFKEAQAESYSLLPRVSPYREPKEYGVCQTVADILRLLDEKQPDYTTIPPITLLRIGISGLRHRREDDVAPTTEELFRYLEEKIPWLVTEDGLSFEQSLWDTLTTCPLFESATSSSPDPQTGSEGTLTRWSFHPSDPPVPSPLQESLKNLSDTLPRATEREENRFQHTLQTLSDFTGYLSTQVYLPYRSSSSAFSGFSNVSTLLSPAEEELRREIRALKGLVLNRRSFMPTLHGAHSLK